jgi:hypothetical protein
MGKVKRQIILMLVITVLLLGPFNLIGYAEAPSPGSSIHLKKAEYNDNWLGIYTGPAKSDKIRITLYDDLLNIKETGLVSKYFQNIKKAYYIELQDSNENSKLDSGDKFIIHTRGEVQPGWGVILTFEPTGQAVAGTKLSGEKPTLKGKNKVDYLKFIILLLIELFICGLAAILIVDRIRRK